MQNKNISKIALVLVSSIMSVNLAGAAVFTYPPTSTVGSLTDNGCPGTGVTVTFSVPDNYTVSDVDLGVNITHTFRGDLDMNLTSPALTNVVLAEDVGGGDDNLNVLFNSDAASAIPAGVHATSPDFVNDSQPQTANALDSFDNENSNGIWTFFVCDDAGQDVGTLDAIELRLTDSVNTFTFDVVKSMVVLTDNAPFGQINAGDILRYNIAATNNGTGSHNNVIVSDPLLATTETCNSLAPAATCTLSEDYTVLASDVTLGSITNTGEAVSDESLVATSSNTLITYVGIVYDNPTNGTIADNSCANPLVRTFNVTDDIVISDLNVGLNISVTPSRHHVITSLQSPDGTVVEITSLGGNNPFDDFDLLLDSDGSGAILNTADDDISAPFYDRLALPSSSLDAFDGEDALGLWTLSICDDNPNDPANGATFNSAMLQFQGVQSGPSLSVVKTLTGFTNDIAPIGVVNEGDVIRFTIDAELTGQSGQTNVVVNDPLTSPSSELCPSLNSGDTCTLLGNYTVTAADRQSGLITNTATAVSNEVASINSNTVSTIVDPQLTIVKSNSGFVDNDFNGFISIGDVLNYTITATNNGNAVNIEITDPITTPSSESCLNVLATETCVLNGEYSVLAVDNLAGNILNTATASINGFNTVDSNTVKVVVGENAIADAESSFYMPLPEYDALTGLQSIFPGPGATSPISNEVCQNSQGPADPISTYSSITILRSNTIIYYDHQEDGYETAPNLNVQDSTRVWGDGDISNGAAPLSNLEEPCLEDSCDVLRAGTIIVLDNTIQSNQQNDVDGDTVIDFDGGDKISSTDTISMTKANWSTGPDTLLAGAFELYPTTEWGLEYEIPVGQDISDPAFLNAKYQYVGITVMASADGTTGSVDLDGNPGTVGDITNFSLDEGESIYIDGGILVGATVSANENVQVNIITGDICAGYESRFITLFPTELWDNSYYNPVGIPDALNDPVRTILYNPNPTDIVVLIIDGTGTETVTVPSDDFFDYSQNSDTAARYCTAENLGDTTCDEDGENFYAIAAIDADNDDANTVNSTTHDWGLTLVPTTSLSQQALVGLGFGQDPELTVTENSSPVWVTADLIGNLVPDDGIQLCVDYDNDGIDIDFPPASPGIDPITNQEYDLRFTVDPYESIRLYDPDGDQTSLLVWVCDSNQQDGSNAILAAAWGQDPATASGGAPAVDVGTGIPNVSSIILTKEGELTNDVNGDGFPSIGDTIQYKISLTNIGFVPVSPGGILTDTLPPNVSYVENTTQFTDRNNTTFIPDNSPLPLTPFPLDDNGDLDETNDGFPLSELLTVGNSFLVTFDVVITSLPLNETEICNNADINVPFEFVSDEFCIDIIPRTASIGDFVWNDTDNDGIQDGGELGIEGVTVTLVDSLGNPVLDGLSNPITTMTDVNGAWLLTDLPAGDYRVLFDTNTSTDGLFYSLTSPNQGGNDAVDSDGLPNGISGQSLTSIFTLAENGNDQTIDGGFVLADFTPDPQLCYSYADNGERLITVNPISGVTDDTAPGLGVITPANIEAMEWDLGDPLVGGDEILYGLESGGANELHQLLPTPRASIGTFDQFSGGGGATDIVDIHGIAIDWQSVNPVYFASGQVDADTGNNHLRIFTFDPSNAEVIDLSPVISLPGATNAIDDLAWDAINRRLLGIVNSGAGNSRIVEFSFNADLSTVTANDCGEVQYFDGSSNTMIRDIEGLTMGRPGELFISTGNSNNNGAGATRNSLFRVPTSSIVSDCSIGTNNILASFVGPANTLSVVPSPGNSLDHEAVACGLTFTESNASIGNRVWLDEDGDGLQSAGEDGIGGASVYLCRSDASPCDSNSAIRTEITDSNGGYLFDNVPLLDYIVAVNTSTLPSNLASNPTYDEDSGTLNPDSSTVVSLNQFEDEHLTADFGYNWNQPDETEDPDSGDTGSIGDRVWSDTNGDGVQDSNEIGLNTVDLLLFNDPDNDGVFDNFVGLTTTDENGNYVFDDLPTGAYVVQLDPNTLPAGVTWTQTGDPDDFGQIAADPDHQTTSPVVLSPGDVYVNADFGYQGDAANTHNIGSTIYLDANANGAEDGGEPGIGNVTVSLFDSVGNTIAQTTTDADGEYLFTGLPDGNYTVVVTDINNVLAEKDQSGDPDAVLDSQSNVTVSGGDELDEDFGYTPEGHTNATGLIGDTVYYDLNGNGSQNSNESGIEGVKVELISNSTGFPIAVTFTDENGNYSFGNLPDDTYTVRVDTSTLPNGGANLTNTGDPDGGNDSESTNNTVTGGTINLDEDFGYQVTNPNTLGGTLWNDSNADGTLVAVDESGRFEGVTINLLDPNGNIVGSTTTDASGNYQFTGLPDGTYTVSVTDDSNLLAGHWLTDGPNDNVNNNSQIVDYTVSLSGGENNQTADFGYYVNLASVGNIVFRDDDNDGFRDLSEPGIADIPVTLTVTYPNGDSLVITVLTDLFGEYSFNNLLADDDYNGQTGSEPTYNIVVGGIGNGFVSSYDGTSDVDDGSNIDDNSDNDLGEAGFPIQGSSDNTNDFGYAPAGVIGDRVWLDLDGDGVQDANEDGIANIIVELLPPNDVDLGNGNGLAITTITDSEGNYLFPNIPLTSGYTVTVTNPPSGLTQSYDEDGTGVGSENSSTVDLTIGNQEYLTADFGYTASPGSIGDYIWSDANRDGQQDTSEIGLSGVTVYLCALDDPRPDPTCGVGNAIDTAITDATGRYLFTGVTLTDSTFVAVDETTLPVNYVQTFDPDGVDPTGVDPNPNPLLYLDSLTQVPRLNTSNGINLDADFGYHPADPVANHFSIGDTIFLDLNGDGLQDVNESGVPGITVHLLIDTNGDNNPDTAIASLETDGNGMYVFSSLPEGETYGIVVTDTRNILNNFQQTADPDAFFDGQSTIVNLNADNDLQDFGYRPLGRANGSIGDRIFNDVNGDGTQNAGDQGLEGVLVSIFSNNNLIDSVRTDENGNYLFTSLSTANVDYDIVVDTATLPNGGAGWTNNVDPEDDDNSQSSITLTSLLPINLDQDFGYVADVANTIGGTVWRDNDGNGLLTSSTPDESANGIQNVTVVLTDLNNNIVATTTTLADGSYEFAGLPNGSYSVSVTDDFNELANLIHTDGPNAGDNLVDNNSQDDTGYIVAVSGGEINTTADFGYKPVVTTPITLASFKAVYNKQTGLTTIKWSTLTETGNVGFELFSQQDGIWVQVTDNIIASKSLYKTTLTTYEYVYKGPYVKEWVIVDIDIMGKHQSHGVFKTNLAYGKEDQFYDKNTKWQDINVQHKRLLKKRNEKKTDSINQYIRDMKNEQSTGHGEGS